MVHDSRLSMVVPYSKQKGPPEFSATLPPMVDAVFEAGSTVKSNPFEAAKSMASCVITPAWQVMVLADRLTDFAVRRVVLTTTVRLRAGTVPPVSPEAPPRGMMANFISLASRTRALICSGVSGSTTSSGSSMRRSVASVAAATSAPRRRRMQSSGMTDARRPSSSRQNSSSASWALQNMVMPSLMAVAY